MAALYFYQQIFNDAAARTRAPGAAVDNLGPSDGEVL
jgi:hypothetical protein